MELRIKRICQLCMCLMLMLLSLPTAIIKADTGNALSEFSDIVEIYGNDDILYVKNAKAESTITIDGVDHNVNSNGEFSATFSELNITGIEGTEVVVVTANDKTLNYRLKEIPFETDGRTIKPELTTITDGEYFTFYSQNIDGSGNPHRLNHALVVKSGGVLYVGGGGSKHSGFSVGYGGEGTLMIETGGTASIHTDLHYNGSQIHENIVDSKGTIVVDGGLYQVDADYAGVGYSETTDKNTEGKLIIRNNGQASIFALFGMFIGCSYSYVVSEANAKGIIQVESGSLDMTYGNEMTYAEMSFGEVSVGTGTALGEIRLAEGQSMTINNNTFNSYDDDFNMLPYLNRSENSSFVYYNWDGTNGYYTNSNEVIEFEYGFDKDKTGNYAAGDFVGLDTTKVGTSTYLQGLLSAAANATDIKANGYQLNDHMYESKKTITVLPAIVQTVIPVTGMTVDYGEIPTTLPETVVVTLNNGSSINVPVNWNMSSYNAKQVGKQEITGILVYPEYVEESSRIETTSINVTVREQVKLPETGVDNNHMIGYGMMWLSGGVLIGLLSIDKKRKQVLK